MSEAKAPVPVATTAAACHLCGRSDLRLYHDQVWRRLLKCRDCRIVFADPLPTPEEKYETERQAYVGEALPETAEFFANCNRNFKEDAVIRVFRRIIDEIGREHAPGKILDAKQQNISALIFCTGRVKNRIAREGNIVQCNQRVAFPAMNNVVYEFFGHVKLFLYRFFITFVTL